VNLHFDLSALALEGPSDFCGRGCGASAAGEDTQRVVVVFLTTGCFRVEALLGRETRSTFLSDATRSAPRSPDPAVFLRSLLLRFLVLLHECCFCRVCFVLE
jgi:hypothetical protein